MILYLLLLATGSRQKVLSAFAEVAESTMQGMLKRARKSLYEVLSRRWNRAQSSHMLKPQVLPGQTSLLQHVGLLVDSVPVQIGRPKALPFQEAKAASMLRLSRADRIAMVPVEFVVVSTTPIAVVASSGFK